MSVRLLMSVLLSLSAGVALAAEKEELPTPVSTPGSGLVAPEVIMNGDGGCYERYAGRQATVALAGAGTSGPASPGAVHTVVAFAVDLKTGSERCSLSRSTVAGGLEALKAQVLKSCNARRSAQSGGCHIVMVDGEWVARAGDFANLPGNLLARIRDSHVNRARRERVSKAQALPIDQLAASLQRGDVTRDEVFTGYPFVRPLRADGAPRTDFVALVRPEATHEQPAVNPWLQHSREQDIATLKAAGADILLAPVQTIGHGFNEAHRMALGLSVAAAIERDGGPRVHDPVLVARLFPVGQAVHTVDELRTLAGRTGARHLLIPSFGHDNARRLFARFKLVALADANGADTVASSHEWDGVAAWQETDSVLEALDPLITGAADRVLVQAPKSPAAAPRAAIYAPYREAGESRSSPSLPTPDALPSDALSGPGRALLYQWLAALVPDDMSSLRASLYARSLVMARQQADLPFPGARLLRARALAEMGALPAARALLDGQGDPAMRAYLAFSNGQLAAMQAQMEKVGDPLQLAMLRIDLARLIGAAGLSEKLHDRELQLTAYAQPAWATLLEHRLMGADPRGFAGNASLVPLVSQLGRPLPRDLDEGPALDKALVLALSGSRTEGSSCDPGVAYCPRSAYVDLLWALAVQGALRPIEFLAFRQRLPDEALRRVLALEPVLAGQPNFEMEVAQVLTEIRKREARRREQVALEGRLRQAQAVLRNGIGFTENQVYQPIDAGMSEAAYNAYREASMQVYPPPLYGYRHYGYLPAERTAVHQRELDYLFYSLPVGFQQIVADPAVQSRAQQRFGEHYRYLASQSEALARRERTPEAVEQSIEFGESLIRTRPDDWIGYRALGNALARDRNDFGAGAQAFLRFPGLHERNPQDPVRTDSIAAQAGDFFFWRGDQANARVFYDLVRKLRTGSERHLSAEQRVALMNGEYVRSYQFARLRVERYSSSFGLRDALAWMFLLGEPDDAWATFTQTHNLFRDGQPWLAAQVGARLQGLDWADNVAWLQDARHNQPAQSPYPFSAMTAVGLAFMDRVPATDAAATVAALERREGVGRAGFNLASFSEGMQALHAQDPGGAFGHFAKVLKAVPPSRESGSVDALAVVLPYAAYAAMRADLQAQAWQEPVMGRFGLQGGGALFHAERAAGAQPNFDVDLARAFRAGLAGRTDEAVRHLVQAMNYMPYAMLRPIHPDYQWAEACEWLYRDTGEPVYRQMALDWAGKVQVIQPFLSWPYAIEASLTEDPGQRLRATAIGLSLDPHSLRLGRIPGPLREQALAGQVVLPWLADLERWQQEARKAEAEKAEAESEKHPTKVPDRT